ncbi:esterase-like activity of phytase family protein [Nocardia spumae]|uniref:esterase-like activity of phytase family protein n=1 Tax=Nocardia spumae TaxID=2887190 RepID=UPI001D1385A5|nr:esterase-like activity of phytase family protein [Nocardia spumae]
MRTSQLLRFALAGTALLVAACSSGGGEQGLRTDRDHPLTLALDDLATRTGGGAAVAFGKPGHGRLDRTADGSVRYTPDSGFRGADTFTVTTSDAVHLYSTDIPALGSFGGVTVQGSGFGSAWTPVPGSADEFYGLTDRGPNVDGPGKNEKLLPIPDFVPEIGRFRLTGTRAELDSTIELRNRAGVPFNGLVDTAASTGETMRDLDGHPLPPTDHGLDPEGLAALADGTFWISDEYGPFLLHLDASGREIERLAPGSGLPRELSMRTPNQGMEGLTVTPDGRTLVGIIQSALRTPGLGSAREVPITRIVTVDLRSRAVGEFVYPLEDPESTLSVSDITALDDHTFLVDERDGELAPKANKKLWTIDLSGATDIGPRSRIPGTRYDPQLGLLVGDRPLETYVGKVSTADGVAALAQAGITPVAKKSNLDLAGLLAGLNPQGAFFGHDKIEGVATTDGGKTLYLCDDSDFGLAGSGGERPPFTVKPKILPDGRQDTGEILRIDTRALPARTRTDTVTVTVG